MSRQRQASSTARPIAPYIILQTHAPELQCDIHRIEDHRAREGLRNGAKSQQSWAIA
jgi:hypothetical protein